MEKVYFEYKGFKVIEYKDTKFAKYAVTNTSRCFDDLAEAICYCIGAAEHKSNDSQLMAYVDTFITMIKKTNI